MSEARLVPMSAEQAKNLHEIARTQLDDVMEPWEEQTIESLADAYEHGITEEEAIWLRPHAVEAGRTYHAEHPFVTGHEKLRAAFDSAPSED